jgi:hypothetical protein
LHQKESLSPSASTRQSFHSPAGFCSIGTRLRSGDFSAHQAALGAFSQVELVRAEAFAGADIQPAVVLVSRGPPLQPQFKIGVLLHGAQVGLAAAGHLDAAVFDFPIGGQGGGLFERIVQAPAGKVFAVKEQDKARHRFLL